MSLPRAVLFDLLTALLDSWSVWNAAAGSERAGRAWRVEYLRPTYRCGAYHPYEDLVRQAAQAAGLPPSSTEALEARWDALPVWSGAQGALDHLVGRTRLGVVTNCSVRLGRAAAARLQVPWDVVSTAGGGGFLQTRSAPVPVGSGASWRCRGRSDFRCRVRLRPDRHGGRGSSHLLAQPGRIKQQAGWRASRRSRIPKP
jgi:hypothetical protein